MTPPASSPFDLFGKIFKETATTRQPSGDSVQFVCNQCSRPLFNRTFADFDTELPRKLFYCGNVSCEHYGLLTVVAVKK